MSRAPAHSWPLVLRAGETILRPLRRRDRRAWDRVRENNRDWLTKWEATRPAVPGENSNRKLPTFSQMIRIHRSEGRTGRSFNLAIWHKNDLVGQITLGGVVFGALRGAHIGYWIDQNSANQGITTHAVTVITKFAFDELNLHRIEINLRPENAASRRVAEKAGYQLEGERPRFLHIDGQWRDHLCFVKENPRIL
ncbi:MAG: GNAT family N-acetyltransferase [Actinobacteria bacterium]|nr:GNAT family N-acetyltransferase [Actinomycetota bacterium]